MAQETHLLYPITPFGLGDVHTSTLTTLEGILQRAVALLVEDGDRAHTGVVFSLIEPKRPQQVYQARCGVVPDGKLGKYTAYSWNKAVFLALNPTCRTTEGRDPEGSFVAPDGEIYQGEYQGGFRTAYGDIYATSGLPSEMDEAVGAALSVARGQDTLASVLEMFPRDRNLSLWRLLQRCGILAYRA